MTKQEAEPIILDLFYRGDKGVKLKTEREHEAADLWHNQSLKVSRGKYIVWKTGGVWCFFHKTV